MLPNNINNWIISNPRPVNRDGKSYVKILKKLFVDCNEQSLKNYIITSNEAKKVLDELGIKKNTVFYEFYSTYIGTDSSKQEDADLMYDLDEIYEDYQAPFWADKYPGIQNRYLQFSSIEGEWSYFYNKEADAVYGVDWSEMDDLMAGKLKPKWKSFYDFLEWYYSEK